MEQGSARWAHNPKVGGSNPSPANQNKAKGIAPLALYLGGIAQLVEQRNHNPCVIGSSPVAANHSLLLRLKKSKL